MLAVPVPVGGRLPVLVEGGGGFACASAGVGGTFGMAAVVMGGACTGVVGTPATVFGTTVLSTGFSSANPLYILQLAQISTRSCVAPQPTLRGCPIRCGCHCRLTPTLSDCSRHALLRATTNRSILTCSLSEMSAKLAVRVGKGLPALLEAFGIRGAGELRCCLRPPITISTSSHFFETQPSTDLSRVFTAMETQQATAPVKLPRVAITYCTQCKWLLRAAYFGQELLSTFGTAIGEIALIPATGGVFTVHVTHKPEVEGNDAEQQVKEVLIWDRKAEGGFPETKILKQRVRNLVEPDRSLGHSDTPSSTTKKASNGDTSSGFEKPQLHQMAVQDVATSNPGGSAECEDCK